jgi:hypothetical protein
LSDETAGERGERRVKREFGEAHGLHSDPPLPIPRLLTASLTAFKR